MNAEHGAIVSEATEERCWKELGERNGQLTDAKAEIERLRAAVAPFLRYYDDIRFNLRKQPRPTDAAIEESGERHACVTWAEFYALRAAFNHEQKAGGE